MTKKPSKTVVLIAFLSVFSKLTAGVCEEKDLSNERPFVSGKEMETYWKIDCKNTEKALSILIGDLLERDFKPSSKDQVNKLKAQLSELKKCGHIYNNPQNDRFKACPSYAGAASVLNAYLDDPKEPSFPLTAKNFNVTFFNCL